MTYTLRWKSVGRRGQSGSWTEMQFHRDLGPSHRNLRVEGPSRIPQIQAQEGQAVQEYNLGGCMVSRGSYNKVPQTRRQKTTEI